MWGALALAFFVGFLLAACQDGGSSLTGATSMKAETGPLATTAVSASHSGSNGSSAEEEDDESEDEDEDDASDEDDDSDDVGEDDDDSDDDDSIDDDESEQADDSDIKGLFFGTEACPTADCVLALRIKDALVVVTSETEIVNEAAGGALVSPFSLEALVTGHPGLPMKAEGSSEGGDLVASKLRIGDEIRATGEVVPGAPGCDFGLVVQLQDLCFGLSPEVPPPAAGTTVRVEGLVQSDFALPFLATRIEPSDD